MNAGFDDSATFLPIVVISDGFSLISFIRRTTAAPRIPISFSVSARIRNNLPELIDNAIFFKYLFFKSLAVFSVYLMMPVIKLVPAIKVKNPIRKNRFSYTS